MTPSNGTIATPDSYTQTYATVGALAVLLWDIFLHLPQDYKLATQYRVNIFFVIYWIARVASFLYVLGVVIISTAAVEQCHYFRLVATMYPFAMPLTVLHFVVRVFALYGNNKFVIAFFSLTWLTVLGTCILMPIGVVSVSAGTKRYCLQSMVVSSVALRFCLFIHDSCIFLATSWALMRNSYSDANLSVKSIKGMVLGKHLLPFSKSILRDGQAYYLTVLLYKLVFLVLPYSLPQVRTQCTIAIVLLSNMSSYVYRNMRLGFYEDYTINKPLHGPTGKSSALQHPESVFQNPTPSTNRPEDGGDLEAGDVRKAEGEVEQVEVTGESRDSSEKL